MKDAARADNPQEIVFQRVEHSGATTPRGRWPLAPTNNPTGEAHTVWRERTVIPCWSMMAVRHRLRRLGESQLRSLTHGHALFTHGHTPQKLNAVTARAGLPDPRGSRALPDGRMR